MEHTYYLPAEWHTQSYIQLTWPHAGTDWKYMLEEVEACFLNLAREIAKPPALIACRSRISESTRTSDIQVQYPFRPLPYQRHMGTRPRLHHPASKECIPFAAGLLLQWLGNEICRMQRQPD